MLSRITQVNQTNSVSFQEKNNRQCLGCQKTQQIPLSRSHPGIVSVVKAFCSSDVTIYLLQILYAEPNTVNFNLYFFHQLLAWKFPPLPLWNPLLSRHSWVLCHWKQASCLCPLLCLLRLL